MSNKIYIIVKVGPEWEIIVEAHLSKSAADARCKELDKGLSMSAMDRLSGHEVKETKIIGA